MEKFTKILETTNKKKFYKSDCKVELVLEADTEGEAGHLIDSDLGGLEYLSDFTIGDIKEITKEEYKKKTISESTFIKTDLTNESLITYWENKFGGRTPTQNQKFEFYHLMRLAGYDKDQIFETLKNKF